MLPDQSISPGDLVSKAMRYVNDPEVALISRVAFALVIACGGEMGANVKYGDVVALLGDEDIDAVTVRQALYMLREQGEAVRADAS